MKKLDGVWEDNFFRCVDVDLDDGVNYKLYLGNWNDEVFTKENPKGELERKIKYENGGFQFDKKYDYVWCYGREVQDFHTIDKPKLFTLNYYATQHIDNRVVVLESENKLLKEKTEEQEKRIEELEKKLADEEIKTAYFDMKINKLYSHLNL